MNKTGITILTIIVVSVIVFLFMYYFTDFGLQKSLIISGGAAAAMIIFDVIVLNMIKEDNRSEG